MNPVTGELLGIEAIHLGSGTMTRTGDPATMIVTESVQEILSGDRALPFNDKIFPPVFMLRPPKFDVTTHLISVYKGVTQIGTYDVVILNKGERDSLEVGHVLTIMQSGRMIKDPHSTTSKNEMVTLPSEVAGSLMVFRTFEKTSLALVMRANRPIHVMDTAVTPQ